MALHPIQVLKEEIMMMMFCRKTTPFSSMLGSNNINCMFKLDKSDLFLKIHILSSYTCQLDTLYRASFSSLYASRKKT